MIITLQNNFRLSKGRSVASSTPSHSGRSWPCVTIIQSDTEKLTKENKPKYSPFCKISPCKIIYYMLCIYMMERLCIVAPTFFNYKIYHTADSFVYFCRVNSDKQQLIFYFMSDLNYVWFGKYLQVVNTGLCYHVYNGDLCLTTRGFASKRQAIVRAIELQDEFYNL